MPVPPWWTLGPNTRSHWQFPVLILPPSLPHTNSDSTCVWGGKRRPGHLELVISICLVSGQKSEWIVMERGCCILGQVSFCSWPKKCVCACFNRPISPFTNHPFCGLMFSSLKYEKLRVHVDCKNLNFRTRDIFYNVHHPRAQNFLISLMWQRKLAPCPPIPSDHKQKTWVKKQTIQISRYFVCTMAQVRLCEKRIGAYIFKDII